MLRSEERNKLRAQASLIKATYNVGKNGITPELTQSIACELAAKELVKVSINNNCPCDINYVARVLSERTASQLISVMGKKITLYKKIVIK